MSLKAWKKGILSNWYLLPIYALYKLAEDRLLGWANFMLDGHRGYFVELIVASLDYLPLVTWIGVPVAIIVLLVLTWRSTLGMKPSESTNKEQEEPIRSKPFEAAYCHSAKPRC